MKICIWCQTEKNIDGFKENRNVCKNCRNEQKRNQRKIKNYPITTNPIKICTKCKIEKLINQFHKNKLNVDGLCELCKECRKSNTNKFYKKHRDSIKKRTNDYYKQNKEKVRESRKEYASNRSKNDLLYKLSRRLRNRLYYALKKNEWKKNTHFSEYIGCSLEELKQHLESQFESGMTWDNYGKIWDIDHIIPLSNAYNDEMMYKLCHYKNLRPLCSIINRTIKKDRADICWQKLQRDKLIEEDKSLGFPQDTKASDWTLAQEKITKKHRQFIQRYEWLGTIGFGVRYVFTARFNGVLGGVVMIAEPNGYQFDKKLEALIQRGACASLTPKNLGSRLVMFACRWMIKYTNKRIFVAYSDPEAGEVGTIYQACNFDYLGQKFGSSYNYKLPNGKLVTERYFTRTSSMKKWAKELNIEWKEEWTKPNGFQKIESIPLDVRQLLNSHAKSKILDLPKVKKEFKGKYVLVLNNPREIPIKKTWESHPYPKRNNSN